MHEVDEPVADPRLGTDAAELVQALAHRADDATIVERDHEVGSLLDERPELGAAEQELPLGRLLPRDVAATVE